MSDGKCKCGEDINFAINNGKCDGCIEGYIENLECDNTAKDNYIKLHAGDCCSLSNESDMFRERCEEAEAKIKRMEDNLITDCEPCPFDEAATTLKDYTHKIEAELASSKTEANDLRVRVEGLLLEIEGR